MCLKVVSVPDFQIVHTLVVDFPTRLFHGDVTEVRDQCTRKNAFMSRLCSLGNSVLLGHIVSFKVCIIPAQNLIM